MISENEKAYKICDKCSKIETCEYYKDVVEIIHKFKYSPLNIHFPKCLEYYAQTDKLFDKYGWGED